MMCEHEWDEPESKDTYCTICGKSTNEVRLEQQLAAANAELAELQKQNSELFPYYQDHLEGALIPATEYQQWIKRAEQAEAQCAAMRNCRNCRKEMLPKYNYQCEGCFTTKMSKWEPKDSITAAGSAIIDRLHRMEGALNKINEIALENSERYACKMIADIAKAALEEKL